VGIAFGPVRFQGTPGSRLLIRGLALDDALRLAGDGDPGEIQDDPLEMRGAVRRPEGLFSRGVVASAGFLLRHKEQQSRRGIPYWRPGSTESVAGIDTAFCFYPVRFSQEESPSSVIYMVALDNAEHAPLEVRRLPTNDFQHFHIQDATLGPLGAPSSSSSSSSSKGLRAEEPAFGHGAGFDPFSAPSEESPARTSRSYPEDLGDISTPATSPLPPTSRMPPPPLRPSRRAPPPPPIKSLQPINALLEIEDDDENDEFDTPDADTSDEGILLDGTEELPLPSRAATAPRARPTGAFDPPSGPVLGYLPPEHFGKVETPDPMEDATEDSFSFAVPADILDEAPPTRSSDSAVSTGSASMAPPPAPPPAAADDEIREVHFELPEDVELTDPELHSSSGPPLEPLAPAPGLDLEDLMATDERDVFIEASQLSSMRSEAFREQLAASREPPLAAHRPAPISHSPSPPPASDDLYASLANLLDTDAFDASPSERPIEPVADAPLAPGLEEALDADDSEFADLLGQTLAEAERGGEPRPIEADAFGSFVQEPPPTQDFELPPPPTAAPMHEFGDPEPTETVAAPAAPAAPTAGASGRFSALRGTMIRDLGHVFANYRLYRTPQGEWLFGHHHGRQVLDAHRYDATHDLTQACTAFLKEKVAEGFVLRGDRLQTVPANSTHEKLDLDLLGRIFREMTEA
jgi:hypothetical protein